MSLSIRRVPYASAIPKLWNKTIEAHRRDVRAAVLDTTAALVAHHGLRAVTMSQIAEKAGIGRATLYKYFPDVEAILVAWHEREIGLHFDQLADVRERATTPVERLEAVLEAYASIAHESRGHGDPDLAGLLHEHHRVAGAQERLHRLVRDLLADAATAGEVRRDVGADELATYCLSALAAASRLRSRSAVGRLVAVTLAGVRPR